jgi:hypothetical protein
MILFQTMNQYGIPTDNVIGAMSDSVAVNICALASLGMNF